MSLRLVGGSTARKIAASPVTHASRSANHLERAAGIGEAIADPTDPRWVLAVRTAAELQGAILAPERREKLLGLGKTLGLSAFDANLVIAIVQDQARRGYEPQYCPTAGEKQLRLVPVPRRPSWRLFDSPRHAITAASLLVVIMAFELMLLWYLFGG